MPELEKGMEKQRSQNITVWIGRVYHKKVKMIAYKEGVSITHILNSILRKYFEKGNK